MGLVRKAAPGRWGGVITPSFKERFGQAYDTEIQRWVDAVRAGTNVDGPTAWDGYAAAAVCAAGCNRWRPASRLRSTWPPATQSRGHEHDDRA
jgi:predicted dehydrogenase